MLFLVWVWQSILSWPTSLFFAFRQLDAASSSIKINRRHANRYFLIGSAALDRYSCCGHQKLANQSAIRAPSSRGDGIQLSYLNKDPCDLCGRLSLFWFLEESRCFFSHRMTLLHASYVYAKVSGPRWDPHPQDFHRDRTELSRQPSLPPHHRRPAFISIANVLFPNFTELIFSPERPNLQGQLDRLWWWVKFKRLPQIPMCVVSAMNWFNDIPPHPWLAACFVCLPSHQLFFEWRGIGLIKRFPFSKFEEN